MMYGDTVIVKHFVFAPLTAPNFQAGEKSALHKEYAPLAESQIVPKFFQSLIHSQCSGAGPSQAHVIT
jgi:hypothetical protein